LNALANHVVDVALGHVLDAIGDVDVVDGVAGDILPMVSPKVYSMLLPMMSLNVIVPCLMLVSS
jgi:hypothetical protein